MSWLFPNSWSAQQQRPPGNNHQDAAGQPWYSPSVLSSSSRPSESSSSYSIPPGQKPPEHFQSISYGQVSPADTGRITAHLKKLSTDELRKLLSDKEAYTSFFNSLDQVKEQNTLRDELRNGILQLVRENLDNEQKILELRNQCTIIRTTELAAAQDRLNDHLQQRDGILRQYSPGALLGRLHESMAKSDREPDALYGKLVEKEIDLPAFVQNHKGLRMKYHRKALIHIAARTSVA